VNVGRLILVVLVFMLSGAPASAVLCDLVLCGESSPAAAQAAPGCHEHAAAPGGERALSAVDSCSHLSFVAPFLTPGPREAANGVMLPVVADVARCRHMLDPAFAADRSKCTASPHALVVAFQPLRI
jgi:hypothetical protein